MALGDSIARFGPLINYDWNAQKVRELVEEYEAALPTDGWPNWVLGNHDQHRIASRVGAEQARIANMLLLTLRGTPTTYYGEEIGMENVVIPTEFIQDPPAINQPEIADMVGRDPERTPMQWDSSANAGFARKDVTTWLPVANNFKERNVVQQNNEPTSMLNLYRALAKLRQDEPALSVGEYASVETAVSVTDPVEVPIFAYQRTHPGSDSFLIVLNFGSDTHTVNLSHIAPIATIAIATSMQRTGAIDLNNLVVNANEGLVLRLTTSV